VSGAASIPYGDGGLDLPATPFRLDALHPPPASAPRPAALATSFDRPIGSGSVADVFRGAKRVLVAVSDATRATAAPRFLPLLVERIRAASGADVRFIVASGIHRPPTAAEEAALVGPELHGQHAVLRHDPDDGANLVDIGRTGSGTVVRVHRALREHDRIVLTGAVGFHYYAGFTGGRKAVVPGTAGRDTIARNHLRALRPDGSRDPAARAGCLRGNPVHRDMAESAALVGPHLLVNSVLGDGGEIERLFVGHWRRAHEAACRHVRDRRTIRVVPRDLVIVSAGGEPGDVNVIQSHKAFEASMGALRPGGVMVLVARCREGAGHAEFLPWLAHRDADALVDALRARFQVYGQTALAWIRKAAACRLILVSSLPAETVRALRAEPAADLAEAFAIARRHLAAGTAGWVLRHGSRYLIEPVDAGEIA
jgi:nickel-dependent lactate racemase